MLKEILLRHKSELRYNLIGLLYSSLPHRKLIYRQRLSHPTYFLSVVTRIKNEARFLPEFIAHHKLIGAEHFYFYDNNSNDNPDAAIQPFIDRGLATVIPWNAVPASPSCYCDFFDKFASESKWVAFIDADEFIVERQRGLLLNVLSRLNGSPALAINYRYFGSSFHETVPTGLVTNNFVYSSRSTDPHVKVIAKPKCVKGYYNSHNFIFDALASAVNLSGKPVRGTYSVKADQYDIEISHYIYRSKNNYLSKLGIGFVDKEGYKYRTRRKDRVESEFLAHNALFNDWVRNAYGSDIRDYMTVIGYKEPYV
ncbi:MAG: glycosyltransferase family 92 protein [Verrucomicrobia bacterium]|nr:glycosyltransferase family 92 protein [Verrucomicrobiota bacterium]MBV8481987.1 glycosyltransferase family 92 protein [Verrucomicrobiota bacterium]